MNNIYEKTILQMPDTGMGQSAGLPDAIGKPEAMAVPQMAKQLFDIGFRGYRCIDENDDHALDIFPIRISNIAAPCLDMSDEADLKQLVFGNTGISDEYSDGVFTQLTQLTEKGDGEKQHKEEVIARAKKALIESGYLTDGSSGFDIRTRFTAVCLCTGEPEKYVPESMVKEVDMSMEENSPLSGKGPFPWYLLSGVVRFKDLAIHQLTGMCKAWTVGNTSSQYSHWEHNLGKHIQPTETLAGIDAFLTEFKKRYPEITDEEILHRMGEEKIQEGYVSLDYAGVVRRYSVSLYEKMAAIKFGEKQERNLYHWIQYQKMLRGVEVEVQGNGTILAKTEPATVLTPPVPLFQEHDGRWDFQTEENLFRERDVVIYLIQKKEEELAALKNQLGDVTRLEDQMLQDRLKDTED